MLGNLKAANARREIELRDAALNRELEQEAAESENNFERVIDPDTRAATVFLYERTVNFDGQQAVFYGESFDDINAQVKRASERYYGPITKQGDTIPARKLPVAAGTSGHFLP